MASCCCCCCYNSEEPEEEDYEVYVVEDGDEMQNFGVRHTLELLRRMMNQSGRPIVDQPPPSYAEFDKYPLANEDEEFEIKSSPGANLNGSHYLANLHWASRENVQPPLGASAPSVNSPSSTWIEPFPRPPGEPPPVPSSWFLTRLASMRRSLVARFAPSTSNAPPPRTQPAPDTPEETVPQVDVCPTSEHRSPVETEDLTASCSSSPVTPNRQDSECSNEYRINQNEGPTLPTTVRNAPRSLTAQSSIQTEYHDDERVIPVPAHAQKRQFRRSVNEAIATKEIMSAPERRHSL